MHTIFITYKNESTQSGNYWRTFQITNIHREEQIIIAIYITPVEW